MHYRCPGHSFAVISDEAPFLETVRQVLDYASKHPVLMTIGCHDYNTPFEAARQWYDVLKAPRKEWVWFEDSAHSPIKEEPDAWYTAVKTFLDSLDLK